ncbi:MAG TPA: phosphate/phosphite/phosphonate ABC transporter substrate-binding protein [Casimicrobiaceae bacterium]|nr:phosphate/phosphite/phosphonate ABC transporter substrate-binding protein [Casimicrobiaceae bacterium]
MFLLDPQPTERARPRRSFLRATLVAAGLAAGLGFASATLAQGCEDPKVLKFSIIPTQETVRELTLYKPVMDLLSKNTGKKIEFYMPTSYSSVVEALMGKWVDVAMLGPESYVIAHGKEPSIEVFATYYKKKDGVQEAGPGYKSMLISKKGSKFTSIDSTKGSVMLLVDPASTSGALIPESVFATQVVKTPLKQYFSKVAFSGGHDLSTLAVADGKADVAFVASHRFMNTIETGKVKLEDFNILWSSPLIPQDPFVYRGTLCAPLKEKIANTFLTLGDTPEGKKYLENVGSEKFVKMTDKDYDIIRQAGIK